MWLVVSASAVGCGYTSYPTPPPEASLPPLPGQTFEVFTPAHSSVGEAIDHFFNRRPTPEQPFDFPHVTHVERNIRCDFCHSGVNEGPVAGIPGVGSCMICHQAIATESPRIQQLAALNDQGLDLAWERVFGYDEEAHVRFNHAPHIRAEVECATCHGPIAEQTVAQRNVELTMGTCVNCHNERGASIDCLTCHF